MKTSELVGEVGEDGKMENCTIREAFCCNSQSSYAQLVQNGDRVRFDL